MAILNLGNSNSAFSGSFSGSFKGDGSGLTNILNAQTASFVTLAQTASFVTLAQTASFVATAQTASYIEASNIDGTITSASYALSASYAVSASFEIIKEVSSSYADTASYVENAQTASYVTLAQTASFVTTAQTASYVLNAQTASFVTTAQTASYVLNAQTASFVTTAQTASYVLNAVSSSYALSSSFALTASHALDSDPFPYTGSANITGSLGLIGPTIITGSLNISGSDSYNLRVIGNSYTNGNSITTGNVGVGTTTPAQKFEVRGTSRFSADSYARLEIVPGSTSQLIRTDRTGPRNGQDLIFESVQYSTGGGRFIWRTNASSGTTENMRLNRGLLGIGTSSPQQRLHVQGNITASGYVSASSFVNNTPGTINELTSSYAITASHALNVATPTLQIVTNAGASTTVAITGSNISASGYISASEFVGLITSAETASYVENAQTASYVILAQTASFVTLAQTASYVTTAQTASYVTTAQTASYVLNAVSSSYALTASYAVSASHEIIKEVSSSYADTASYVENSQTASYVTTAQTASYVLNAVSSSYALTASYAVSASHEIIKEVSSSYADTASYVENAQTASYVTTAQTASYVLNAVSSSYALTASYAVSASHEIIKEVSSSYADTASYVENAQTASYVTTAQTASYVLNAVSSSYALTASYAVSASHEIIKEVSSSYADTASYVENAQTASFVTLAQTASYVENAQTASYVLNANNATDLVVQVKNTQTSTILKGQVLHSVGVTGEVIDVITASNDSATSMPGFAVANQDINSNAAGQAIISGKIKNIDTSGLTAGSNVYVNLNGDYTGTKPTGSSLIQNIGVVGKVNATEGELIILGAGRSNDVPNISPGYIWIGNSDSVATPTATSSIQNVVSSSYASTASYVETAQTASYVTLAQTASYVTTAQTASYVLNAVSSSYALSASYAVSASHEIIKEISSSYADTASYVETSQTASYILASNIDQPFTDITASGNISASGIINGLSGSFKSLDVFVNLPVTTGSKFRVGRMDSQYIGFGVGDYDNIILAKQDVDSNLPHNFILDRDFEGTGANNFKIQKNGIDQFVIDTSGNTTTSGNISASGDIIGNTGSFSVGIFNGSGIFTGSNGTVTIDPDSTTIIDIQDTSGGSLEAIKFRTSAGGDQIRLTRNGGQNSLELLDNGGNSVNLNSKNPGFYLNNFAIGRSSADANNTLSVNGNISASGAINTLSHITSSGNISASGYIIGNTGSFNRLEVNDSSLLSGSVIITGSLSVEGPTAITGSAIISSSNSTASLTLQSSGSTVFDIQGSQGQLFSVTDDLIHDVLLVNDISGNELFKVSGSGLVEVFEGSITTPQGTINSLTASHAMNVQPKNNFMPVATHTTNFTSTSSYAGHYNIVGGNLSVTVTTGSTPTDLTPGMEWNFFQTSSGNNFTFTAGTGINLVSRNAHTKLAAVGSAGTLKYISDQTFHLIGDLTL